LLTIYSYLDFHVIFFILNFITLTFKLSNNHTANTIHVQLWGKYIGLRSHILSNYFLIIF